MIEFPTEVTKEFILRRVSQEEIFEMYGVSVTPYMFKSPLRTDHLPTCKFYKRSNGRLVMRDYTGHFWGDCFDLVTFKTGKKFYKALEDIALRFKLINGSVPAIERTPLESKVVIEQETCKIRVNRGKWTPLHLKFWERLGVSRGTLKLFNVYPLERAWVNDEPIFWYGAECEIAFVYHFPEYGLYEYKLYFPFREKMRFVHSNASILQGWSQLPATGPFALVTKSYKDVIAFYEFGVPAIAPMAETLTVGQQQAKELNSRFPKICSLYDIDKLAGVTSMQQMKRWYGWTPLFFNPRKGHPKDFTEFIPKYGVGDARLLVDYVKELQL